jgi:AraC family transcriptional regulator
MPSNQEYIARIHDAIDFIYNHLDAELDLAQIAGAACYSPYHFHRLFSAVTGESPRQFANRVRLEKSASDLRRSKSLHVTEIAFKYGFSSNSSYTKVFKKHFGVSPSHFRKNTAQHSKIRQVHSKNGKASYFQEKYLCNVNEMMHWLERSASIEMKYMPSMNIAYIAHTGPFDQIGKAYERLLKWAFLQDLNIGRKLSFYHDDADLTDLSKLRQGAGIVMGESIRAAGEVRSTVIEKGGYAVGRFEIAFNEFERAWQGMMVWMSEQGFSPDNKKVFYELYHNDFREHPENKNIVDLCIPLSKLQA